MTSILDPAAMSITISVLFFFFQFHPSPCNTDIYTVAVINKEKLILPRSKNGMRAARVGLVTRLIGSRSGKWAGVLHLLDGEVGAEVTRET